jgi:hypothetical protein
MIDSFSDLGSEGMIFVQSLAMERKYGFANHDMDVEPILDFIDEKIEDFNTSLESESRYPLIDRSDPAEVHMVLFWWRGARSMVEHMWRLHGNEYNDMWDMLWKVKSFLDDLGKLQELQAECGEEVQLFDPSVARW